MNSNLSLENIQFPEKVFVTGIGTDVGKTYVTGILAKALADAGKKTITQKFIQTGNVGSSEDIVAHRKIMEVSEFPEDKARITAPVIFSYPCSPDLASRIDNKEIDFNLIKKSTEKLAQNYQHLLIEGAGGVMVPLKGEYLTIDYIKEQQLPVIVTYNGQLGSINHTLLTVNALLEREIPIFALVYNTYFDVDRIICEDTKEYMKKWLKHHSPKTLHFEI